MSMTWRRAAAVPFLFLPLVAAGCGSEDDATASGPADAAGAEPLVVDHVYGTTEIDGVPERIVTIDLQWTDTMLAMGVEPIGYTVDSYMPDGTVPWQDLPADAEALDLTDGVPIEQIAALDPDLIVGSYSIADERTYELLSGIAPTVPNLDDAQVASWQELVTLAGNVLDRPDDAVAVVDDVDGAVAQTAADLPGLEGQTFALAQYVVGDSMYIVADENDGSSVFFQQLGMEMFAPVRAQGEKTGEARINVSTERADLLRADLLAFLVNGGDERDLADIPAFDTLPGTVAVLDYPTIVGLNTPSPLSIPYALEQVRPYLDEAAA
ncbi:ABC transporter substrate-binding protein [Nocardioides sp. YIM 152315]|uniref:ABC transporter substrate-binding protein n=1 Tax=Nocardioides sp. YIM 152315 TaxID=3031760 RepID=UPI0023DC812E|nr:ABC transporter substrate-binding protein [Nocardioides sp. YIM 152315]MDF1603954.1 ABC transporter substrate-binding protein [Nocardioides sp. YIM 152315]